MWRPTQQLAFSDAHAQGHGHVIAEANPPPSRGYRYRSFLDEKGVYDLIASRPEAQRSFFEMIVHSPDVEVDSASRVHFDIEWDTGDIDKATMVMPTKQQYLDAFCDYLDAFMQKHYGVEVPRNELLVLNASIPSKLSFHVLLPLVFTCIDQRVDFKARILGDRAEAETDAFLAFKGCPDEAIYTKNRVFRLPLCNKIGKENHLTWWVGDGTTYHNRLMTNFGLRKRCFAASTASASQHYHHRFSSSPGLAQNKCDWSEGSATPRHVDRNKQRCSRGQSTRRLRPWATQRAAFGCGTVPIRCTCRQKLNGAVLMATYFTATISTSESSTAKYAIVARTPRTSASAAAR